MAQERAHVVVHGEVQGVGYRYSARNAARELRVVGWVRNMRDGVTVEAVVEGEAEAVGAFIRWCHRGPSGAMVLRVDVERGAATGEFASFAVRY